MLSFHISFNVSIDGQSLNIFVIQPTKSSVGTSRDTADRGLSKWKFLKRCSIALMLRHKVLLLNVLIPKSLAVAAAESRWLFSLLL